MLELRAPRGAVSVARGAVIASRRHVVELVIADAVAAVLLVTLVEVGSPQKLALAVTTTTAVAAVAVSTVAAAAAVVVIVVAVDVQSEIPPRQAIRIVFDTVLVHQEAIETVFAPPEGSPPPQAAAAAAADAMLIAAAA